MNNLRLVSTIHRSTATRTSLSRWTNKIAAVSPVFSYCCAVFVELFFFFLMSMHEYDICYQKYVSLSHTKIPMRCKGSSGKMRLTLNEKETHKCSKKCIAVMCTDATFFVVPSFFLFYFFIFKNEKVEFKTKDLSCSY